VNLSPLFPSSPCAWPSCQVSRLAESEVGNRMRIALRGRCWGAVSKLLLPADSAVEIDTGGWILSQNLTPLTTPIFTSSSIIPQWQFSLVFSQARVKSRDQLQFLLSMSAVSMVSLSAADWTKRRTLMLKGHYGDASQ